MLQWIVILALTVAVVVLWRKNRSLKTAPPRVVEVPHLVEIPKIIEVEKVVEVPKIVEVEKVVEITKIVEVEKLVEVPTIVEVEKIVEVPATEEARQAIWEQVNTQSKQWQETTEAQFRNQMQKELEHFRNTDLLAAQDTAKREAEVQLEEWKATHTSEQREDAIKRSKFVNRGLIAEQFARRPLSRQPPRLHRF